MKVILISVGNYQEYIQYNIKNLLLFGNDDITVICDKDFFSYFDSNIITLIDCNELDDFNFNNNSRLDRQFRNGFWHLCSLRLFYLYSYIKKYNIENCIHIENDVMVYENLSKLNFGPHMYVPFDHPTRVIPSIIFIPTHEVFKPVIENYNNNLNDMQNLAIHDFIKPFPIIPKISDDIETKYNMHFNNFSCIFDAASIGQYLSGVDPKNQSGDTRGFVNETCIIKYNQFKFHWIKTKNLYKPFICINNTFYPIVNLHIHSKQLQNFMADNPIECNNLITKFN